MLILIIWAIILWYMQVFVIINDQIKVPKLYIKKFRFVSLCANFTLCEFSKKIQIAQSEGYLY